MSNIYVMLPPTHVISISSQGRSDPHHASGFRFHRVLDFVVSFRNSLWCDLFRVYLGTEVLPVCGVGGILRYVNISGSVSGHNMMQ